ncbi:uncharacterized protein LOC127411294 [Myxocyprinus asiaticus]|uniref:uncharacterized protein LOC127411294 n=1 Tax=Myxocyprinus asiaticus TaxID=70543 RepID=UPI0022230628|nr:uncharacterized protein LOC127411294 [Myxocyprinus asiaticus]
MGNIKLPKKFDVEVSDTESALSNMDLKQSTCSIISIESVTKPLENLLTADKIVNSNQDMIEKEIICATSTSDTHKALISKNHRYIYRNDSKTCDSGLTLTNLASLNSSIHYKIENINENRKEDKNDAAQVMDKKTFNNRYFQMSDSAIHDKISEVVKEHFKISLIEDCGGHHTSDTNKQNSSSIWNGLKSEANKHKFQYENIQTENPTGGTSVHLVNCETQTNSKHSLTMNDPTDLKTKGKDAQRMEGPSKERKVEQVGPKCGNSRDNMQSEVYCAIESQSTDRTNVSESVFSCVKETAMGVNTSSEKTLFSTQQSKDYVDASNTVQQTWVMAGSRVTVLKPLLQCTYAQVTPLLEQTNGLDKVQKADLTKSRLAATNQGHEFNNRPLMHGHLGLSNDTLCSPGLNKIFTLSTKSNFQVSLPSEATVKHTASGVHSEGSDCNTNALYTFQQVMEESAATLTAYSEVQNENTYICPYNSTISSMEHCHSTVDDDAPEARHLSKLAFYEFGSGNLGKHHSCVSQDKTDAKHALEKTTTVISSSHDTEHKYQTSSFEDLRKDATISDVSPTLQLHSSSQSQRPQTCIVLKTCAAGKIYKEPQSENQSVMEMATKSRHKDGCIKATLNCNNQPIRKQDPPMPQKHQSTHMQKREPDKSIVKPSSPVKVYHKTPSSLNTEEHSNSRCKSTDNIKGEHPTAVDDTNHVDDNVKDDRQRGKQKRCRRAHFTAPPNSSIDSTPDLSFDEITTSKIHVSSKASRTKPGSQASGRQSAVAHDRYRNPSLHEHSISAIIPRSLEVHALERHTQQPNSGLQLSEFGVTMGREAENETIACQGEHGSTEIIQKTETIATKADKDMNNDPSKPILGVYVEDQEQPILHTRDSAMHFASSDINPFLHTRTAMELNQAVHKFQAFGSATNIADQHTPPDSSNKNITRCNSVDNGLNIQISPLSSHLSTYANHKGLSSTLSSAEDSRDQISSEPLLQEGFYSFSSSKTQTQSAFGCESYNGASVELNQSSGQVDEKVLVYSSEYESQEHGHPCRIKCDHGTQTTVVDKDLKGKTRHRRSSTQTPMSKRENGAPNTWASLQNMSEHLFDFIYSTSDLLGNIQCMRTGETPPKYEHPKNCFKFSTVHSGSNHKKDCYTQTSMDFGIQTDNSLVAKSDMAHEVNVIVKVIGSDVSELDGDTKNLREQAFERIKSMPDLQHKDSKAADSQNSWLTPRLEAFDINTVDHSYKKSSSSFLGAKDSPHLKREENQPYQSNVDLQNRCNKQVMLMDRASSPILTVKAARYAQQRQAKTSQRLTNHESTEGQNRTFCKMQFKSHKMSNHENKVVHQENLGILHTQSTKIYNGKSVSSMTLENQSDLKCPNLNRSDECSINSLSSSTKCMQNKRKEHSSVVKDSVIINSTMNFSPLQRPSSTISAQTSPSSLDKVMQSQWESPDRCHLSTLNNQLSHSSTMLKKNHRSSEHILKNWQHLYQSTQEDDAIFLVPSECNTDVLVGINPLTETSLLKEHQWIPDDLPIHNKFTIWSGINQQPPSTLSKINRPFVQYYLGLSPSYLQPVESQSPKSVYRPELLEETNRRTREIERLRKEREQVLSSLRLDLSPHQLTVELTEARLHYGQGETDTLLKMLKSDSKEEPSACTKQELLDRHRRSIESLRRERDAHLQACHRARSLSPSKHRIPINHEKEQSQRISDLPCRRREYLQQLRQEVVETSRVPDPPRQEDQCPSDIELLLRDYSRAHKEARAEIARARDRLRERIEQEKRRIQQQALSQAMKDDLRLRTRISNSTLCTGSNLTLSSGPTSGYNSSNSALLQDNTSPIIQVNGVSGFQVRTRPPVIRLQTLKPQRRWLSVQDVSLETSVTGYEPESHSIISLCSTTHSLFWLSLIYINFISGYCGLYSCQCYFRGIFGLWRGCEESTGRESKRWLEAPRCGETHSGLSQGLIQAHGSWVSRCSGAGETSGQSVVYGSRSLKDSSLPRICQICLDTTTG